MLKTIIGIDPGLASLGWGIILHDSSQNTEALIYRAHGVITTSSSLELAQRLLKLDMEFEQVMRRYHVQELAYEYQFFVKNVTSGLPVAHALGVVLLYSAKHNVRISHYTPLEVKKQITGNARASKETVNKFVRLPLRIDEITVHEASYHHAADALAVAVTHALKMQGIEKFDAGNFVQDERSGKAVQPSDKKDVVWN